jgi:thiamine kinase-like enzyme
MASGSDVDAVPGEQAAMRHAAELERICALVPELAGPERTITPITGGMTNHNYRVATPAGDYVVRIAAGESGELGINRDNEHHNSLRAAEAAVGAPVVARVRDPEALVVGFVAGVTLAPEHFSDPRRVTALAAALQRLHQAQPFARDFDMAQVQERYHEIVVANGYPLPVDYARYADRAQRMSAVLAQTRVRTAPCHNDLMPGNFIESDGPGSRLWIVDYEYSGNNDPGYDLGDAINELELDAGQAEQLVTAYYGSAQPQELARARLWSLMSQWGWSLWGSIRIGATGDPEIQAWADALWARAVAQFESSDFEELLIRAQAR